MFFASVNVTPDDVRIARTATGTQARVRVMHTDVGRVCGTKYIMRIHGKLARFFFTKYDRSSQESAASQPMAVDISEQEPSKQPCIPTPLPGAKSFSSMHEDRQQELVNHAICQRLDERFSGCEHETADALVDRYDGLEHVLFDVTSLCAGEATLCATKRLPS